MKHLALTLLFATFSLLGAADGGCKADNGGPAAPNVEGTWDVVYDDALGVEITLGGSVYNETLDAEGGTLTIDHNGQPIVFNLRCERPEVICPSEVWPASVTIVQRNKNFLRHVFVTIPGQRCDGTLVTPPASECGPGTLNSDCDDVCDGTVQVTSRDAFGVINPQGSAFDLLLGAGVATNGLNCVLLGLSVAKADLVTIGSDGGGDWEATAMRTGQVATGYAGGCLWAGDPNDDGQLEALVLGAAVKFTTSFEAQKR
ncbi:MAG: hypothetical protein ACI9MR_000740 [Myxococcota bacterium]|jgi:hypothetical protein